MSSDGRLDLDERWVKLRHHLSAIQVRVRVYNDDDNDSNRGGIMPNY